MKIIILNGPPSSGKDTTAKAISEEAGLGGCVYILRMSAPNKECLAALLRTSLDSTGNITGMSQHHKEQINPILGVSPRQWQIDFSERFMKPLYGEAVFARIWLHRAAQLSPDSIIIVPDLGFPIELNSLLEAAHTKHYPHFTLSDIFLIRLYRLECSVRGNKFVGDSREYVYTRSKECRQSDILNGDLDLFLSTVLGQVHNFLAGEP